jgi:hypothetical protein
MTTELPLCRWRRQPTQPGFHVCISPRVRCNADGIPDTQCNTCLHRNHDLPTPTRRPCRHFGELLGVRPLKLLGRIDGASIPARVHRCALHGECSPNTGNTPIANCLTCPDHSPDWIRPAAGSVRHLTYFLWPAGPWWMWNVQQLRGRLALFNGVRLVAVAVGDGSASLDQVREEFAGDVVELLPMQNDAGRREMVGHMELLRRVSIYRGEGDAIFYGHGKGASSHPYGEAVRKWADAMYTGLLDYWPAVQRELVNHAAVGVFRRLLTPVPASVGTWHYSGTFRWIRNKDLFSRNWQVEDGWWMGSETYPGRHFRLDESCCLFGEFAYGGVGLYGTDTWSSWAQAALDDWRGSHRDDFHPPQLVTCILTTHRQAALVHEAIRSVQAQTADAWELVIMDSGHLSGLGAFDPYTGDARIRVVNTGWGAELRPGLWDQSWKINEAWRRGLVRGGLVVHLADDDAYAPRCFEQWLRTAAREPNQKAWYGVADRARIHHNGYCELLSPLGHVGDGRPDRSLRCHVDGLQVCVRRELRTDWPEAADQAAESDGFWMEALARKATIHQAHVYVGTHRHTPLSTHTQ